MSKKSEGVTIITPVGTLRYPKITTPDTKGEYADNKFKTDIAFSDADFAIVEKAIKEAAKTLAPEGAKLQLPLYDSWDEGKGIRAKSQYRPAVFDAKNTQLPETLGIGGGTEARLAVTAKYYKKGKNEGINLYLNKVQIKKLVEWNGGDGSPFDEMDGEALAAADDASDKDAGFDSL